MEKELIKKYLMGNASFEERKQVIDWSMSDPENLKRLEEERKLYLMLVLHTPKLTTEESRKLVFRGTFRKIIQYTLRVAAVLGLGVGLAYLFYSVKLNELTETMVVAQTQAGQRTTVILADGTTVYLNSGSKIEYPVMFSEKTRKVRVVGEAMFDVTPDAKRPFIVETFACNIEVLGTKFNVRAEEQNGIFSAALLRGEIKVTNFLYGGEQITMKPSEVVTLEGRHLRLAALKDMDEYVWTEGYINLRGRSFMDLILEFEKVFNTRIIINGHIAGADREYQWGKILIADGIEDALNILQASYPFTYKRNADANEILVECR